MAGDRMMKLAVLMIPCQTRTHVPPLAIPAPISPPISACEELLGSPSHQVMRFQTIAAMSAHRSTSRSMMTGSMIPTPMVLATGVPTMKAAMKLKNAAQ